MAWRSVKKHRNRFILLLLYFQYLLRPQLVGMRAVLWWEGIHIRLV